MILNISLCSVAVMMMLIYDVVEMQQTPLHKQLISADAMIDVLGKSHDGGKKLVKEKFIENYQLAGGTSDMAVHIYMILSDGKDAPYVPLDEVEKHIVQMADLYARNEFQEEYGEMDDPKNDSKNSKEGTYKENKEKMRDGEHQAFADQDADSDHMKTFDNEEDSYPAHDPIYQPSEEEEEESEVLSDNKQVPPEAASEKILSYEDDFARIEKLGEEEYEEFLKNQVANEDMEDHEPIYQPFESEEIELEEIQERKETIVKSTMLTAHENESEDDYEEIFADVDENDDGYPDHDPIYQPEDSVMTQSLRKDGIEEEIVPASKNREEL